jgi:serine/threonine-protein kinase
MHAFSPDRWRVLSPYLDEALDIAPEERADWLESIRKQNPALATDLQTLLREHGALGDEGFLDAGAPTLPSSAPRAGQTLGAYTLESPIGQGGMGTVWAARRSDGRFEGRAAIKFLNVALLGGGGEQRFKREGSFLARLAHPNIAHLIDAGVSAGGQPYLVLEYVEGHHLDAYCSEHALDIDARIRLFLDVIAAVAHAHANLIVHRDIKPSNVLVTAEGQVKLLDFGIAKLLEDEAAENAATVLTREGGRALTLAYAAPEQVTGTPVTTGTDVYALGVLLYLLVSGKHPAESVLRSPADLMKAIVDTEPPRPSEVVASSDKLRRALRGDLDTIVAKALKKDPAERYVSVTAFADDLRRYLEHQTISARPDTLVYRVTKFVRRNRLAGALAAAAFIATVAGVVGTAIQARTARIERDFALRQLSRAEAINELNAFVLSDSAPSGKPFVNELVGRAEEMVRRQGNPNDLNQVELRLSVGGQYLTLAEYAKAHRLLTEAYQRARALPDPSTRARTACALAQALAREGDLPEAERLIQEGLGELPDEARFALDRVGCLLRGSEIAVKVGHSKDAVARAEAAQRALSQSPFQSGARELDVLINLATGYRHAGQVREAIATFEQASARLTDLGYDQTLRAQVLFNNWGTGLLSWGRPLDSERVLRKAVAIGQDHRAGADVPPPLLVNYARCLKELGRFDEAADYADRAYSTAQELGDKRAVIESLLMRTGIYRSQGDLERAAQLLSEAEPIFRRSLRPGQHAFASLALERGLTAQARGDAQAALDFANQAVGILEASLKESREGLGLMPNFLVSRSEIELQLHDRDKAAEDARRALKMSLDAAQPGTLSSKVGRAYVALGRALEAHDQPKEARAALRSGVEHLQSALGSDHLETRAARKLAELEVKL